MSRIEKIIDELEDYVETCKYQTFSTSNIVVNKEEILELLSELRENVPDEIRQYQKIISNQEAILSEAKTQANSIVKEANKMTEQLVDEHEIMQKAYATANKLVDDANTQANSILEQAQNEANHIRSSAIQYTDDMLKSIQTIMSHSMDGAKSRFDQFMSSMQSNFDTITQTGMNFRVKWKKTMMIQIYKVSKTFSKSNARSRLTKVCIIF